MLTSSLIHPPLIGALASAGHGTQVLIADGNFPYSSHCNPDATLIHLNLRPGLLAVDTVLDAVLTAVTVEHAAVMRSPDPPVVAQDEYRSALPGVEFDELERFAFYERARCPDTALVIATGDERLYANLLLTIGLAH